METLYRRILVIAVLVGAALLGNAGVVGAEPTKPDPELTLKTTSLTMVVGEDVSRTIYKDAAIHFANDGSGMLAWRFYIGSDFAGCAVESTSNWLQVVDTVKPYLYGPGAASALARVTPRELTPGEYHALICMESNDRDEGLLTIPLTVIVR